MIQHFTLDTEDPEQTQMDLQDLHGGYVQIWEIDCAPQAKET
jgi:hypothetical protein